MKPLVAIVGRPNVGKSTLFNRIVGTRAAIVEDVPGVTRDRHYADADWNGRVFTLIDTGGLEPEAEDEIRVGVRNQALLAVDESDCVVLVFDAMEGLTATDREIAEQLRRTGRPILVAANKIDSEKRAKEDSSIAELHELGFEVHAVSAEHGRGIGDLLDGVLARVDAPAQTDPDADADRKVRLAILGRPNVGKSTLVNKLLGEDRFLTTEVPGTTRDSIDSELKYQGRTFVLTDTAGIRRKKSIHERVEKHSVARALRTLDRCDVVVLMLDTSEPAVTQEAKLGKLAMDHGKAVVLAVNKWDLRDDTTTADGLRERVREQLPELDHAPIVLLSALEGKRVFTLLEKAAETYEWYETRISTPDLNAWLAEATRKTPPPLHKKKATRIYYVSQVAVRPPRFLFHCNRPDGVPKAYRRYLVNQLREAFGFPGVPLVLSFRARRGRAGSQKP